MDLQTSNRGSREGCVTHRHRGRARDQVQTREKMSVIQDGKTEKEEVEKEEVEMEEVEGKKEGVGMGVDHIPRNVWYKRQDVWMWVGGNVFITALMAAMFGLGISRGWSADSGFTHNDSVTSQERFLPEPDIPEEGVRGRYGPGATSRWYYWKLKTENLTFWTHFFPWVCYISHQVLMWAAIYRAQMAKAHRPVGIKARYSANLDVFNWTAFGFNLGFHLIHLAQTHFTYDATAQDVSIATSQASVIMLLTLVIMMEYRERGIAFRWPMARHKGKVSRALRLDYAPMNLLRRYHGYAFAWASIYTFWYHPMENTWGHAMGFVYTWLVLLQGSLMYTPLHLNKWWRCFLEVYVVVHAGVVAAQTGGPDLNGTRLWPMFVFGFALAFVITQIFSLPIWDHLHAIFHLVPFLIYMSVVIWCYSWIPDDQGRYWVRMSEIVRIPSVYYIYFILGWLFIMLCLTIEKKLNQRNEGSRSVNEGSRLVNEVNGSWNEGIRYGNEVSGSGNEIRSGNEGSRSGNEVSRSWDEVSRSENANRSENEVNSSGNEVNSSENEVNKSGNEVNRSDNEVNRSDNEVSRSDNEGSGSATSRAVWMGGAILVYGVMVGLGIVCEYDDWQLGLITLMIMFVGIYIVGVVVSMMLLKQIIPQRIKPRQQIIPQRIKPRQDTTQLQHGIKGDNQDNPGFVR